LGVSEQATAMNATMTIAERRVPALRHLDNCIT